MASFNRKVVHCKCLACFETERCLEAPCSQAHAFVCSFAPAWECLLGMYRLSFKHKTVEHDLEEYMARNNDPVTGARVRSSAAIVQVGRDDLWRNVAYGEPITQDDLDLRNIARERLAMLFRHAAPLFPAGYRG